MASGTVLLIEDDLDIRDALGGVLRDEGYDVAFAGNGREGLQWLRGHPPPSVVLLDLMMPVMDGYEFRTQQRADPGLSAIPVICISAGAMDARVDAMQVHRAFKKPLDLDALLDACEQLSGRSRKKS